MNDYIIGFYLKPYTFVMILKIVMIDLIYVSMI
jgi:hypothetical protein